MCAASSDITGRTYLIDVSIIAGQRNTRFMLFWPSVSVLVVEPGFSSINLLRYGWINWKLSLFSSLRLERIAWIARKDWLYVVTNPSKFAAVFITSLGCGSPSFTLSTFSTLPSTLPFKRLLCARPLAVVGAASPQWKGVVYPFFRMT